MITAAAPTLAFASAEDAANLSDTALQAADDLSTTAIEDAVKRDHILYYDSATSRLYSNMNYDTKEFSEPIDFPGAICEGNKLTLTSEFQNADNSVFLELCKEQLHALDPVK